MNRLIIFALSFVAASAMVAQNKPDDVIKKMTTQEKCQQMSGVKDGTTYTINSALAEGITGKSLMVTSGRNKRLGIPGLTFVDGPKGVSYHGKHTIYPAPVTRACSFDKELEYRLGVALGKETAATGANYIGAVTLNLTTHPWSGQAELWYGEDPWLAALMGVQLTRGIQKDNHVMACAKHYAMFELETNKGEINAVVGERALREVYLIPFMKVVQEGNIASIMPAYNKVNGTFCSENKYLLTDIARNEWGFKGIFASDWGFSVYNGLNSIKAGNNIEMPSPTHFRADSINRFIAEGQLTMAEIDNLIRPTIATKLLYGENKGRRIMESERAEWKVLSQESAEKSIVLLKNDGMLPLDPKKTKRILVVGQLAKSGNLGEAFYVPRHNFSSILTPLRGIRQVVKDDDVTVTFCDGENLNELSFYAERADAIIVCLGRTDFTQSENAVNPDTMYPLAMHSGGDRENLDLTPAEQNIIRCCYRKQRNTAVVYYGGSAVITSTWEHMAKSIIFAGFTGSEGGVALGNILFGKVNPSGKLSFSIFGKESDYPKKTSNPLLRVTTKDDYDPLVNPYDVNYDYYYGYTLANKQGIKMSYPFGYGLSYTTFDITDVTANVEETDGNATLLVNCRVSNSGKVAGGEVVQVYVGTDSKTVERPERSLRGFEKVYLNAGESRKVTVRIPVNDLRYWNENTKAWELEKTQYNLYVGDSSREEDLQKLCISF